MTRTYLKNRPIAPAPIKQAVQPTQKRVYLKERPLIKQKEANLQKVQAEAKKYGEEAKQASSFSGMAGNFLKAVPKAAADVLVGTPAKFITSVAEVPEVIFKGGRTSQREYKLPGLSPFKSYQSDFQNVANDVIDNKKGLGSAAWSLAQPVLGGLEMGGITGGLSKGVKAFRGAPTLSQGIRKATPEIVDAFLPTTRGIKNQPLKSQSLQEGIGLKLETLNLPEQKFNQRISAIAGIIPETPKGSKFLAPIRSGQRSLENQGEAGKKLVRLMQDEQVKADLKAGELKSIVKQYTSKLTPDQKMNLTDVLEGKATPIDTQVDESSKALREMLNKVQSEAKGTGLETGYLENYFPRKYNWDEITKAGRKEKILQSMVDSGQAGTKAEAEQFLNDFIFKNTQRKSGNLEYERMFDIEGYERDPEKALTMYADSAARRITEAKMFGKKDEIPSALINKISEGGGDYREAQKVFDYVYKGEPKNSFAQFLLGYNAFTKLSLGFFSNLTQSVNTAAKGGLLNTLKGAGQALAQGIKAVKKTDYDDISVLANTLDDHVSLQEAGLSNKFMNGAMYLFQKIENFNRRTASNTGVLRAKELADVFKKDPNSAFASRQLESLGIKVEDIINGTLTEKQLLTAANKMTRITQFKIDALNLPTMWRSPLGKVLSQFKSFSFMQTKFIRDEIFKEAKQGNLAPLLRFFALAPIASYMTQSMRNTINSASQNTKDNVDFRKGDLYRKAIGDLPTDIISQLQYANEKKDKWYTTPLTNVKNWTSPITGPTGSDIFQLLSGLEQKGNIQKQNKDWYENHPLAQKDPNLDLKRFAVQKIPFIGRRLANTRYAYKPTVAQEAKEQAQEAIRSENPEQFREAIKKDPYLNDKEVIQRLISDTVDKDLPDKEKAAIRKVLNKKYNPFYQN